MKLMVARVDDFLQLPSGKKVNPRTVIPLFELGSGVREFRIMQERRDHITVDIVPKPDWTETIEQELKSSFFKVLGEPVEVVFNLCEEIPRGRHNRPRPIRSLVDK